MVIEKDITQNGKRQLVIREHCLPEEEIAINIKKIGDNRYEVMVNNKPVDKRLTMIWLFEETSPGKFVQSKKPFLPKPVLPSDGSNVDTFWQRIEKSMVTTALNVCHMTYNDKLKEEDGRVEINNDTWCVMKSCGETLYLGFRGTDDSCDWLSNLNTALAPSNELNEKNGWPSSEDGRPNSVDENGRPNAVKFHKGFDIRSRTILQAKSKIKHWIVKEVKDKGNTQG